MNNHIQRNCLKFDDDDDTLFSSIKSVVDETSAAGRPDWPTERVHVSTIITNNDEYKGNVW